LYVLFLSSDAHPRGPRSLPTRRSSDLPVNRPTCTSRLQSERPSRRGVWWCQQKGGANRLAIGRVNARSNPRTKGGNNVRQRAAEDLGFLPPLGQDDEHRQGAAEDLRHGAKVHRREGMGLGGQIEFLPRSLEQSGFTRPVQ